MKTKQKSLDSSRKTTLSLTILTLFLITGLTLTTAADDEQDSDITVQIEEETIVDIQPSNLEWGTEGTGLPPGSIADASDEQNEYGSIFIENLGSTEIEQVWFDTTSASQTEDPFGSTEETNDPSNFITLGEDLESNEDAQFVNRREFALGSDAAEDFIFIDINDGWDLGRLRTVGIDEEDEDFGKEYFWSIDFDSVTEVSDLDGEELILATDERTEEQTGTEDLTSDCDQDSECNINSFNAEGATSVVIGAQDDEPEEGKEYCAVADPDTETVNFIKWSPEHPGADSGDCADTVEYFVDSSEGDGLVPGDYETINIRAFIPFGVAATEDTDDLEGELTVFASS